MKWTLALLWVLGLMMQTNTRIESLPDLDEPFLTMAKSKTIAVAQITSEKDEIDNHHMTEVMRQSAKEWLEKNGKKPHLWTWIYTDNPDQADLVIQWGYEEAPNEAGYMVKKPFVKLIDGHNRTRVLRASQAFCELIICPTNSADFLRSTQELLEAQVKEAQKKQKK